MKTKETIMETKKETTYYVQEVIGGWKQNAVFSGTLEECNKHLDVWCHSGSYSIVPEWDYEVDYL